MSVWQIACGERGRYYEDIFLDHDVMFLGPGEPGEYDYTKYKKWAEEGRIGKSNPGRVRDFKLGVQPGDLILLRKGYRVVSIGLAEGHTYHFSESLDDIYGWDVRHCRSVSWQQQLDEELKNIQAERRLFEGRKQIPTFTRVDDRSVLEPIELLFPRCSRRPPKPEPNVPSPLRMEELGERLFARGLPNRAVDEVLAALQRHQRLLTWYGAHGKDSNRPTEHEVVAHMVLPLLLALGWSEQLLAIEWNRIDLAAFGGTPTIRERCVLVCEAKQMGQGMQDVWEQAFGYIQEFELVACQKVLLTDGRRFYLYERGDGAEWPERPTGYLNVEKIRQDHVAPKGTSAVDTIVALTPMNLMRK